MIDEEHDRRITSFTNSKKKRERGREKEGNNDYWLGEIYIYGVVSSAVEYLENKF